MGQAKEYNEFVYRGQIDIDYPCYKDAIESFLRNTSEITSLRDAIMTFNCFNFLRLNKFSDWNDYHYEDNKKLARRLPYVPLFS